MLDRLWVKFLLLLLSVSFVGLSAALLMRELMVRDFRGYLEGEMLDRVYWLTASLEGSFLNNNRWETEDVVDDVLWALMLGLEVRVVGSDGGTILDSRSAVESLGPLAKKRVLAATGGRLAMGEGEFIPHALFVGGMEIGRLEVRFLPPEKEGIFVERANKMLLISLLGLGGIAVILSVFFSRRLTRPVNELTWAAAAIAGGDLRRRVSIPGRDEIGRLSTAFNRMADALQKQESLRKRLTTNIAHELRTPLGAMRGEIEGMLDGYIVNDKEALNSLNTEIGRLRNIIDGIEELSRAEASGVSLNIREVELPLLLQNISERFRALFSEKGVSFAVNAPAGLSVKADPERLSQILINLVSNALRATDAGGMVTITSSYSTDGVRIDVSDTGRGINEEDLPHIFERFFHTPDGGLGVGLTIVRELVEAHGGRVEARSEPGNGSVFTVILP